MFKHLKQKSLQCWNLLRAIELNEGGNYKNDIQLCSALYSVKIHQLVKNQPRKPEANGMRLIYYIQDFVPEVWQPVD